MGDMIRKPYWGWFISLISIILSTNFIVYRLPIDYKIPTSTALGTMMDLFLVIPLLTYLFILRRRYSLKYLGPVILAGYLLAQFIIPNDYLQSYSFISYFVLGSEIVFILVEAYIILKIIKICPKLKMKFRQTNSEIYYQERLYDTVQAYFAKNRMVDMWISEITMFYYAFCTWRKKSVLSETSFTYHREKSTIANNIMLIHGILLETVGLHFFIHSWNPLVSWILLVFNIYGIFFLLADIQATRLTPIVLSTSTLKIQIGLMKGINIPYSSIRKVEYHQTMIKIPRKVRKNRLDATVKDLFNDGPCLTIHLSHPIEAHFPYGFKKWVTSVYLTVDDRQFNAMLKNKCQEVIVND